TNIGLDHTQFLGNTLAEIASEKAGIIKKNIPVIIGEYTAETRPVFENKAKENESEIYFASDLIEQTPPSDLVGVYQEKNKKTVLQTLKVVQSQNHLASSEEAIQNGMLNVARNTGFMGRWQVLQHNPKVICDTAHNKHVLEIVTDQLSKENYAHLPIVLGAVNDKDLDAVLPLFPKNAVYYFCKPNVPRGLEASVLEEKAKEFSLYGKSYASVAEAFQMAKQQALPN